MNLKEAFRYQSFLETIMSYACRSIMDRDHAFKVTKNHKCHDANPEAEDFSEVVDVGEFYPNDDVIKLMTSLVDERMVLSSAINDAKQKLRESGTDIDAMVSANKFAQRCAGAINDMLRYSKTTRQQTTSGYKFNNEGNQVPYYYVVEYSSEDNFDRANAKDIAKRLVTGADMTSAAIDVAMVNAVVDYTPPYDVNDSFDDIMESLKANEEV